MVGLVDGIRIGLTGQEEPMARITRDIAASRGHELALADDIGAETWAELDLRINRLVHAFRDAGIGAGDIIALVAGNQREWFETAMACAHSGIIFVPVNWHLVAAEMAYIFADSGAKGVVVADRFADVAIAALADPRCAGVNLAVVIGERRQPGLTPYEEFVASGSADEPEHQVFGGPMFYTSGTTGNPKGVRGSLSSMGPDVGPEIWQLIEAGFASILPANGVTILCGPVYHSAQWAYSFLPMAAGSAVVMQHKYDSAGVLDLIDDQGGTNIHLVPTQMKRLIELPDERKAAYDGSSMKFCIHGAAPCPPAVKRSLIEWWGPIVHEYYGSTEGAVITMINSDEWLRKGGSVGKPLPNMTITVIGDDGRPAEANTPGTLYFRNSMGTDFEYHNAPEKTREAHLEPGVFTTGDVGYLDDEGYLWLSDRKIDMIISGGVNIYPAEIEQVLGGHPDVADVAVIGVPNDEFGEEVKALVVARDGLTTDDEGAATLAASLVTFCRTNLAAYKVPRTIEFRDELPRTGTGKIMKRGLRAPYWEGFDRSF
jgi:long-chain acyl-CoA synthetase